MITSVFAVYDLKAKAFMQPFFSPMVATGIRAFSVAVNDPTTLISKHPEDFVLFHLGSFDDEIGRFVPLPTPAQLCMAPQLVGSQAQLDFNDQHGGSNVRKESEAS